MHSLKVNDLEKKTCHNTRMHTLCTGEVGGQEGVRMMWDGVEGGGWGELEKGEVEQNFCNKQVSCSSKTKRCHGDGLASKAIPIALGESTSVNITMLVL